MQGGLDLPPIIRCRPCFCLESTPPLELGHVLAFVTATFGLILWLDHYNRVPKGKGRGRGVNLSPGFD